MSKILKVCEKSDDKSIVFEKSSFDRFDDDLMEVILNYLTISDKFRLECLSKQVQSLIYNKQQTLRISHVQSVDNLKEIITKPNKTSGTQSPEEYGVYYSSFETVLKKCQNLNTIRLEGRMSCDQRLLISIADNCRQLKNISIDGNKLRDIPSDSLNYFGVKCGPTLHSLRFEGLFFEKLRQLLSFTPQLRSLTVGNIHLRILMTDIQESGETTERVSKLLPKLQEIQFLSCNENSLNEFQNQYSDNIQKITTRLSASQLNSDQMTAALAGFGRFHKLRALDLYIWNHDYDYNDSEFKSIDESLRQLGEDCPQLRQFRFKLFAKISENNNLFSIFSTFKALTALVIEDNDHFYSENSPVYNYGQFRDLRHSSQLKHLSSTLEQLNDDTIDSIDKYLPQLVSIRFSSRKAITDKSLEQLSRLKCLTQLFIGCYTTDVDHNITNEGVKHIIEKCVRLRSLSLGQWNHNFDFDISKQSIEAMVLKSKRMPKIKYFFSFSVNNNGKSFQLF